MQPNCAGMGCFPFKIGGGDECTVAKSGEILGGNHKKEQPAPLEITSWQPLKLLL